MAAPFITLRAAGSVGRGGRPIEMFAQITGERLADVAGILDDQNVRLGVVLGHKPDLLGILGLDRPGCKSQLPQIVSEGHPVVTLYDDHVLF